MTEPLKLKEALQILQSQTRDAVGYPVSLASGNTPEPLSQFLAAYLQQRHPDCRVQIRTGLFGDYYQAPSRRWNGPESFLIQETGCQTGRGRVIYEDRGSLTFNGVPGQSPCNEIGFLIGTLGESPRAQPRK